MFLWGYLKKFPNPNRLKMIFAVAVFSVLFSLMVSFLSVSNAYCLQNSDGEQIFGVVPNCCNPVLAKLSLPFYLETKLGTSYYVITLDNVWFKIFFAGVQLWEITFGMTSRGEGSYIFPPGQINVNYTTTLFLICFSSSLHSIYSVHHSQHSHTN